MMPLPLGCAGRPSCKGADSVELQCCSWAPHVRVEVLSLLIPLRRGQFELEEIHERNVMGADAKVPQGSMLLGLNKES